MSSAAAVQLAIAALLLSVVPASRPRTLSHAASQSRLNETASTKTGSSCSAGRPITNVSAPAMKMSSDGKYVRFATQ